PARRRRRRQRRRRSVQRHRTLRRALDRDSGERRAAGQRRAIQPRRDAAGARGAVLRGGHRHPRRAAVHARRERRPRARSPGRDRAGNTGSHTVTVTRAQSTSGVVITYPPDTLTTNRKTTLVTGRVLTPSDLQTLTIESKVGAHTTGALALPHDAAGAFTVP